MVGLATVNIVQNWIHHYAPPELAAPWDNVGLQIGNPDATVEKILVALDPSLEVFKEAKDLGCELIVTHHPLFFKPISHIILNEPVGKFISLAIVNEIALMAAHTNLDAAPGGVNDTLAEVLHLENIKIVNQTGDDSEDSEVAAMCRTGEFPQSSMVGEVSSLLKRKLGLSFLRLVAEDESRLVKKVLVCSGSGARAIPLATRLGYDALITGDLKYHDAMLALSRKLIVFDVGHFSSEYVIVEKLVECLKRRAEQDGVDVTVVASSTEKDPFMIV